MADRSGISPTHSTHSGTTTNPNTPRSSSSDSSHSIQPTWPPDNIDFHTPALASWQPSNRLGKMFLDINWISQHDKGAFFKIHTRLLMEGAQARRHRSSRGVRVYIFIPPERIRQLRFDPNPDTKWLGPNTVTLTFDMIRPPALLLPKTFATLNQVAGDRLRSLHLLTAQSSFTIHAIISGRRFPAAWMRQLCIAISAQALPSIERFGFAIIPSLYGGYGAQIVEGDLLSETNASTADTSIPPPYNNTVTNTTSRGQKRSSSVSEISKPLDYAAVEALLDARLQTHKQEIAGLHNTLKSEIIELLAEHKKDVRQMLSACKTEFARKLASSEERVRDDVVGGLTDLIEEKVVDEMEGVQDYVMDSITSMSLTAELTFPQHSRY